MKYTYILFEGSPVFVSNEDNELTGAEDKLKINFPQAIVGRELVPEHHSTSAFRLRIMPEVREVLGNI
ncbi:protein of unknown function [Shewanella benthica]|uniref:Uncharacterized protein n=1 Tax=Shewanella benthica TaxID=43661 RepID=A0A330LZZ6_9GAMM|nr:hypothetical protein [Shewanella benthica]SQH75987.1 protein of unknown function [Shewanella benthica]SQH75989.1 protein of unknown function [Shewanella benthica]